jgi:hypothetical protein
LNGASKIATENKKNRSKVVNLKVRFMIRRVLYVRKDTKHVFEKIDLSLP